MGKRKTKRKAPVKRATPKLDKEFNCPQCCGDKTVEVNLNYKTGVGNLLCRSCRKTYETAITPIEAEIDVLSAWIDACEDGQTDVIDPSAMAFAFGRSEYEPQKRNVDSQRDNKRQRLVPREQESEEESADYSGEDDNLPDEMEEEEFDFGVAQPKSGRLAANKGWESEDD